jgi:glycosyltransferase involved in cell wall biosynthesis
LAAAVPENMNQPLKIAVWHNLPSGGGKRALYGHVRGLAERGHTFEFWCPSTADLKYLPLGDFGPEHVLPWDDSAPRPWLLRQYREPGLAILNRIAAMDRLCRAAAEAINAGGFDVLFANSCMLSAVAPIARYVTIPRVLYLQEPARGFYEAMPEPPFIARLPPGRFRFRRSYVRSWLADFFYTQACRAWVRAEYDAARAFDRILVNSYFSRESVLRAYGLEAEVCYLGVDAAVFHPTDQPKGDYVIGVGSFNPLKNIPFVIRALGHVSPPRPRLVWVGNFAVGNYIDELKALAAELRVPFEPRLLVSHEELLDLLSGALAMVYAPRLEPFGYAPLEANACGTPVVAVAEGGVRETVRHEVNGIVVPPHPEEMAAAVVRLRDAPSFARRLGCAGRELVETVWSIRQATERLEGRLHAVLAAGKTQERCEHPVLIPT